ncbi:MAG TPA: PhzF family phenazine biosynthesis protein [Acidobacteriaceae bacterium]|jgi:PhzF family phenazine biosynthesis protein
MPQPIAVVDAFTAEPYRGNPAGIYVLPAPASDEWMQSVAIEMNHAETAFLIRCGASNEDGYDLRWFTPGGEVDLCGHATLASAHYLWETGALPANEQARFHTKSGLLTADRLLIGGTPWIELDFPSEPAQLTTTPADLAAMLGAEPVFVGRNRMDYLVELADEWTVRSLRPDLKQVAALSDAEDMRGIIVTAAGTNSEADIVSRCFYPRMRIDEDPVTGSAHCGLAPYWIPRLAKQEIIAYQASARGGWLCLRLAGNRVRLRGQAVTTLRGELAHDPR